jgi:hypothetical protein
MTEPRFQLVADISSDDPAAIEPPCTSLVQLSSQLGATETPRRATSSTVEDTVRVGIATFVLTTSRRGCKRLEPESDSSAELARVSSRVAPSRARESLPTAGACTDAAN